MYCAIRILQKTHNVKSWQKIRYNCEKSVKAGRCFRKGGREDGGNVAFWDEDSTECDIYIARTSVEELSYRYIFDNENRCKFFDLATNQLAFTFLRKM